MPHHFVQHMCCQNCYGLLQRMSALERDFRNLLSEFKDWHSGAVRGVTVSGSLGSSHRAEDLTQQRTVEGHRSRPEDRVDGNTAVSTARDGQWVQIEARPKRRPLYSSVVLSSTPGSTAGPGISAAKLNTTAGRSQPRTRPKYQSYSLQLKNRFEPLHALHENHERSEHNTDSARSFSRSKNPNKPTADTLIFGDDTVNGVTNPKLIVRCEPNITVPDLTAKLPAVLAEYTNVKRIIVHVGKNDTVKQESELLKRDFNDLLNTLNKLNLQFFISGPLPAGGTNMFSRLLGLNTWLQNSCRSNGLNFIDNFNLFFGRRELFRRDGLHMNKRGVKLLTDNLIFSVCNLSSSLGGNTSAPTFGNSAVQAHDTMSEPEHPPPTEDDLREQQTLDMSGNDQFYQLPETPKPQEESSMSSISPSTSPHLTLPAAMEKLVSAGTRLSLSLSASPQVQRRTTPASTSTPPSTAISPLQSPRLSPKTNRAPSPPRAPQRKRQAPRPPEMQLRSRPHRQQEPQGAEK